LGRQHFCLSLYDLVPYPAFFSSLSDSIFIHLSSSSFLFPYHYFAYDITAPKVGEGVRPRKKFPSLVLFTISFDLRHTSSKIEASLSLSEQKNLLPFFVGRRHPSTSSGDPKSREMAKINISPPPLVYSESGEKRKGQKVSTVDKNSRLMDAS
jgi:hypothetical protein